MTVVRPALMPPRVTPAKTTMHSKEALAQVCRRTINNDN